MFPYKTDDGKYFLSIKEKIENCIFEWPQNEMWCAFPAPSSSFLRKVRGRPYMTSFMYSQTCVQRPPSGP